MNNDQQDFSVKQIKVKQEARSSFDKKYLKIGLVLIIVIVLIIAALAFLKGWFSFSQDKVALEIIGPSEVSSGEEIEFDIHYRNNNRVALKDAKLIIDYPQNAYSLKGDELTQEIIELGKISAKTETVKNFKIRLAGEKGSIRLLAVRLNYQPENISSRFENFTSFKIKISSVLIGLYLTVPSKAISGEEVSYVLDYLNNSDRDFTDLEIELNYPSGFVFKTAEPEPVKGDNVWQLEKLNKREQGTIKVLGVLEGLEGENKSLQAFISKLENNRVLKYSQTSSVTQISSSPLLLSVSLNNKTEAINVGTGEKLNYKIEFKNNTDIALSQLVLKLYFDGKVFDFKTLYLKEKGFFDSLNSVITWSAAGVPSLALLPPGESGEVEFSLSIMDNFPINDFSDKNFKISVRAELETVNVPPQFNLEKLKIEKTLESKVNSRVVLQARAYYDEPSANINNFGPIPPQLNKTTTYTIHWQITNSSNDLKNVRVIAVLPQGIKWQDVYTALHENARLEYNERTKQVIWSIDEIPAGAGFLTPAYELVFQVALTPSITQIGTSPVLIDESSLEAEDIFTNEILESFDSAIDTKLPDDPSVGFEEGSVVE